MTLDLGTLFGQRRSKATLRRGKRLRSRQPDYSPCTGTYAQLSSMENGNYFMSGLSDCVCKQHTYTGAPLWYLPSSTDSPADGAARAIHEYTHAVQKAFVGLAQRRCRRERARRPRAQEKAKGASEGGKRRGQTR